jgi:hypothetical protein
MATRITIEDVIAGVVSKLRSKRTGVITSVTPSGNEYTLNTINTFDIKKGNYIQVLGFTVYVIEVVADTYIKVETTEDLTLAVSWATLQPYFYYGDPIQMDNEINAGETDQDTKYPAVIMFEVKKSKFIRDQSNVLESIPRVRLFFMDQENFRDASIDDLY